MVKQSLNNTLYQFAWYILLFSYIIFYFIFSFTGLLPLISYSYGLLLMKGIEFLVNIDRYLINFLYYSSIQIAIVFLNLTSDFRNKTKNIKEYISPPNKSFWNYVITNNIRDKENIAILGIINFLIGTFILYISFRSMTVFLFYIINSMMLRNICDNLHISFNASNPITNIYMFVFISWGIVTYMIDFSKKLTRISSVSSFGRLIRDIIIGTANGIHSILTFVFEFGIMLIPFVGPAIKELFTRLKHFLYILEEVSNKIGITCGDTNNMSKIREELQKFKGTSNTRMSSDVNTSLHTIFDVGNPECSKKIIEELKKMCKKDNNPKEKLLENIDEIFGYKTLQMTYEDKQYSFKQFDYIVSQLLDYFTDGKKVSMTGNIIGGTACFIMEIMKIYKNYNKYIGGTDRIYNIILRGFIAAVSALTGVFVIVLIMVVFFACQFYQTGECPESLTWL